MKSRRLFVVTVGSLGAAVVLLGQARLAGQAPAGGRSGPGVQAAQDANNADGILGMDDGSVWLAQNDNSDILKVDKNGNATVIYKDTNTGGAVAINSKGNVYVAERGLNPAIFELAPQRKMLANSFQGDPLDCIGGTLHDLVVDSKGGVYFALGNPVFYADPKGVVTTFGDDQLRGNGLILSPDEKRLYITNGASLVAFDVQPNAGKPIVHGY